MLTFHFTGVDGTMTESETLTSGMVGKEVRLLFDESWNDLTKTAVFRAGEITRVVVDPGDSVVIPAEVLERPFGKLFVGVYGTDTGGTVVIPTVMAEGPMIRYGADPIKDDTAKELPVWKNLQGQIGNLSDLSTGDKSNLVSAVNELSQKHHGFTATAARMLVNILRQGLYSSDRTEQIDALAAVLGVTVSEESDNLTHHWDFRTGSLTDRIGGLEAIPSADVTLDSGGAHIPTDSSYLMIPTGFGGASLAGHTAEIKFGHMTLGDSVPMRTALICDGTQPATQGLQWSVQRCWSTKSSLVTEFQDLQMLSGKTLLVKANEDDSLLEWRVDGQLIVSLEPIISYTHLSLGSTSGGAFPLTVEEVRIYPNS